MRQLLQGRQVCSLCSTRSIGSGERALVPRCSLSARLNRVYLAGPRTWTDPEVWGPVEATLLDLALIDEPAEAAFRAVAAALRDGGFEVFSPFEQRAGSLGDSRTGRAADSGALTAADLVVVLDGWADVPGAVDTALLVAATCGTAWASASTVLRGLDAKVSAA